MSVVIGLALCAFGGGLVVAGFRRLFTAVSLSRTEAVPLRRVAKSDGPVEFEGRAGPTADEGAFKAPFSGEAALRCEVWMETADRRRTDADGAEILGPQEPERQRNTRQSWLLAEHDECRRPFVVEEGGRRVTVDPAGAELDVAGHMGETVLTLDAGEPLSAEVRDRLAVLDRVAEEFDGSLDTWDREEDRVKYREARLEPGDHVHVAGGAVESVPDEWGSDVSATVGAPGTDDGFLISEGTESTVVRTYLVQFATGLVIGLVLVVLGLHALGVSTPL